MLFSGQLSVSSVEPVYATELLEGQYHTLLTADY
jgi:hypothetical protein